MVQKEERKAQAGARGVEEKCGRWVSHWNVVVFTSFV